MNYFLIYLVLINAAALLLMLVDKQKARKNRRRIPENTLMLSAALGGSIGALVGMYAFHHKTKHPKFTLGIPAILTAQLLIGGYLLYTFL